MQSVTVRQDYGSSYLLTEDPREITSVNWGVAEKLVVWLRCPGIHLFIVALCVGLILSIWFQTPVGDYRLLVVAVPLAISARAISRMLRDLKLSVELSRCVTFAAFHPIGIDLSPRANERIEIGWTDLRGWSISTYLGSTVIYLRTDKRTYGITGELTQLLSAYWKLRCFAPELGANLPDWPQSLIVSADMPVFYRIFRWIFLLCICVHFGFQILDVTGDYNSYANWIVIPFTLYVTVKIFGHVKRIEFDDSGLALYYRFGFIGRIGRDQVRKITLPWSQLLLGGYLLVHSARQVVFVPLDRSTPDSFTLAELLAEKYQVPTTIERTM